VQPAVQQLVQPAVQLESHGLAVTPAGLFCMLRYEEDGHTSHLQGCGEQSVRRSSELCSGHALSKQQEVQPAGSVSGSSACA
jgi:hypothetical protein